MLPSGDQRGELSGPGAYEMCVNGHELPFAFTSEHPEAAMTQTSLFRSWSYSLPVRLETKAMRDPSGDHCGSVSFQSSPSVSCRAEPERASMIQMCERRSSNHPLSLNL